jgi:carboxypeptidase family protein
MTRARLEAWTMAIAVAGAVSAAAQPPPPPPPVPVTIDRTPQLPPRDAVVRSVVGTARIAGRVVAADTGAPLRRAMVRLMGGGIREAQTISTDPEGNFAFSNLPAGTYSLMAQKTSFLTMQYGQKRIGVGPGKPIKVTEGQTVDRIEVALIRGGVISGRVFDDVGEPVPNTMVQAIKPRTDAMGIGSSAVQTDDLGQFRLHGLQPGEYIIAAMPRNMMGGGDMLDRTGYAQTFYPGTPNAAEAQRVTVQPGMETPNVQVTLTLMPLAKVSGYVSDAAGGKLPQGGSVQLRPASGMPMGFGGMGSGIRPDGSFAINGVAPGAYNVEVRAGGAEPLFARAPVVVNGEDVANVVLIASQGAVARGRIVFEGGETPAYRQGVVNVNALQAVPNEPSMMPNSPSKISDDWTFELKGLFGKRILRAGGGGWMLKSITYKGTDVTDSAIEFKSNEVVDGFEVRFTKSSTTIDATITDANGQPAGDVVLLVFSTDRDKWTYQSRFVRMSFPNPEGHIIVPNLPPGDYYAAAVEPMESGMERNPEILDRISRGADRITLVEGEKKTVTIRAQP